MSFVSGIVGGVLGANAAGHAADTEAKAAEKAQALSKTNQDAATAAQQTALENVTSAEQPYQAVGSTSANHLADLVSSGFTAPNPNDVASTPEYQFALGQGVDAIDKSAAANGTLFSGTTGTALQKYGQGLASQQYEQAFQNAMNTYSTNYQSLLGGSQLGLTSTGQLANANYQTAGNTANIDLTAADQQMKQINNAAAARASGYLGKAKAYSSMIGDVGAGVGNMDFSGGSSPLEMAGEFAGMI